MRRKRGVNALDVMLILLLTLCLVSCVLRFAYLPIQGKGQALSTYRVQLRFADLDGLLADCLSVGELVRNDQNEPLGRIVSVEAVPAKQTLIFNGAICEAIWDVARRCDLLVTLDLSASVREGVIYFDGRDAATVSSELCICTDRTRLIGIIYKYSPVKTDETTEKSVQIG